MSKDESSTRSDDPVRDALDHIMRVARQGISPTKRLDWIEIRARYALEGKPWSSAIRETPRDSVRKMEKDFAACRAELAAIRSEQPPLKCATCRDPITQGNVDRCDSGAACPFNRYRSAERPET